MQRAWRNGTYWLAPWGLLSLLCYTQDHLPSGDTVHSELCPLPSIIGQANALQVFPQTSLIEAYLQLKFPLPKRVWLVLTSQHNGHLDVSEHKTTLQYDSRSHCGLCKFIKPFLAGPECVKAVRYMSYCSEVRGEPAKSQ